MVGAWLYRGTEEITAFDNVNDLSICPFLREGHGNSVRLKQLNYLPMLLRVT